MNNKRKLPSYPIFVKDPNFSLWSATDELNGGNLQTWCGEKKNVYGFIKTNGKTYCFLGDFSDFTNCGVKKAKQIGVDLTAFSTNYEFETGSTKLKVSFVSPLLPNDLELLSMPVCYMQYEVIGDENAEVSIFVNRKISYNDVAGNTNKDVRGGVMPLSKEVAFFGLKRQLPLSKNSDGIGADWGWWYLSGETAYILDDVDLAAYLSANFTNFSNKGEERYIGSINKSSKGFIALGFDETVSINYFGEYLNGLYLENHTIIDALEYVFANVEEIDKKLTAFDGDLKEKTSIYGEEYLNVLYASLRQSIAAHKLVKDKNGNVLFLSKECGSNGCIATVDVSYPSIPLYLLYNPELVKGMMRPIFKFAKMPVWKYDFAPHDVGIYPACIGQVYALKNNGGRYHGNYLKSWQAWNETHFSIYLLPPEFDAYDFKYQMPVEESANMFIMMYACYYYDKDKTLFEDNKELCEKWVEYLVKYGLKPENQLCTDDFAGHLKNNLNLAIKAVVGIAAYAELAGKNEYRSIAEDYAKQITEFISKFSHSPLTWDCGEETFSLKYNLAFDKIFNLGLFPQKILEKEVDYYIEKNNAYGVPLDSRASYTKTDWILWSARLTDDIEKRKKLISPINKYLQETAVRVPFSDWYETADGGKPGSFMARSVQGGCFILLL